MDFVSDYIKSLKGFQKIIKRYYNDWCIDYIIDIKNNNIPEMESNIHWQLYLLQTKRYEIMLKIILRKHLTNSEYNFLIKQPQINELFNKYSICYDNIAINKNIHMLGEHIDIEYFYYIKNIHNIDNRIDKYSIFYNKDLEYIYK